MPEETIVQSPGIDETGPTLDLDTDTTDDEQDDIYLDGTLVLIGCGSDKRDPEDPTDLHVASVGPDEELPSTATGETGPAWKARDLYTSGYFAAKRDLAELITSWSDSTGWAVLSAEHAILEPWRDVKYYDKSIDDIGDDPTNEDHWASHPYRRPDGQEVVTEMDAWAADVAIGLARWAAFHREQGAKPWESNANTLLVLAGQDYVQPLKERGVFEYGIARMTGDPNHGFKLPLETRFLFEEIDNNGMFDQMSWMSDAISRLEDEVGDPGLGDQQEFDAWTGERRECAECGADPDAATLIERDGTVYCEDCHPRRCSRCNEWTTEHGLGGYPLCPDCQTERGGQKLEAFDQDPTEQMELIDSLTAADGGDEL